MSLKCREPSGGGIAESFIHGRQRCEREKNHMLRDGIFDTAETMQPRLNPQRSIGSCQAKAALRTQHLCSTLEETSWVREVFYHLRRDDHVERSAAEVFPLETFSIRNDESFDPE